MRAPLGLVLGLTGLAPCVAAQGGHHVTPARFAAAEAPGLAFWALSPFSGRRQLLLDETELGPLRGRSITAISVRRNMGASDDDVNDGGRLVVRLRVSRSPRLAATASPRFSRNQGPTPATVFAGMLDLPDAKPSPTRPAPWTAPYAVTIPFRRPYLYLGGTLCLDATTNAVPGRSSSAPWWPIDAWVAPISGTVRRIGTSCIADMPGRPADADPASLTVGSTAVFFLRGARRTGSGIFVFGSSKDRAGSIRLPFDLTPFGAPGCRLYTDLAFLDPVSVSAPPSARFGLGVYRASVPHAPTLAGQTIFAQWILDDRNANRLGLSLSNLVEATLAASAPPTGFRWIESEDANASRGDVIAGRVPVLRFSYR